MLCRGCGREYHIADSFEGFGDPNTPGTLLIGGVSLSLVGVAIILVGCIFNSKFIALLGCPPASALLVAAIYIPDSVRVYRLRLAGRCRSCGYDNGVHFWST